MRLFRKKKQLSLFQRPHFAKRILEIGPGHNPYEGVTHAVDKFTDDNYQRCGDLVIKKGVKFYEGDLENLPFDNNEKFDFIYLSHVLEHVMHPDKAIAELNRLANKGYIETPSPLREQLGHADFHVSFLWGDSKKGHIHVIMITDENDHLGEFCNCQNGQFAKAIYNTNMSCDDSLEPLLPRKSKYMFFPYNGEIKLSYHNNFQEACDKGYCAYEDVNTIRRRLTFPFYLLQKRMYKLYSALKKEKVNY